MTIWRWYRLAAVAFSLLFAFLTLVCFRAISSNDIPADFLAYWAAGRLASLGSAASAYDIHAHHAVQEALLRVGGWLPFAYPPPFLFVVWPFSLPPFATGFALWVVVTAGLYLLAARSLASLDLPYAHPAALSNAMTGQNGFLTSAVFIGGTSLLETRPFAAGVVLGVLVIKPQLALLLPFALIAGREWKAIAGAALSSLSLLAGALLVFGAAAYRGFFEALPIFEGYLRKGWPPNELATPYAFFRFFGIGHAAAMTLHALFAVIVAGLTIRAWWRRDDTRVPMLAAASVMMTPYALPYDSLLLVVPIAWLIERRREPLLIGPIWLLCALPVAHYFGVYSGPDTIPLAAILCIWALLSNRAAEPAAKPAALAGNA